MWGIEDDYGLYWAGVECGCNIWKNHWTRAAMWDTEDSAYRVIEIYKLEDSKVVYLDHMEYEEE